MDLDDDNKRMKFLLDLQALNEIACQITVTNIQYLQSKNNSLEATRQEHFFNYPIKTINNTNLVFNMPHQVFG